MVQIEESNELYARRYFRSKDAGLLPPIIKSNAILRIYILFLYSMAILKKNKKR